MVLRERHHRAHLREGVGGQIVRHVGHSGRHPEVRTAESHVLEAAIATGHRGSERPARAPKAPHGRTEQVQVAPPPRREHDRVVDLLASQRGLEPEDALPQLPREPQHPLALLCDRQTPAPPSVDADTELLLELLDLGEQRRLRQVQLVGGMGEALLFGEGDERFDAVEGDHHHRNS